MKTFKTIIWTMVITMILMIALAIHTGLIQFSERAEQHNVQVIVDGELCQSMDITDHKGLDIDVLGHAYIGR